MATNNNDFRLELYRQAWQQARHNEQLRGTFTGFYVVIVAAFLAIIPNLDLEQPQRYGPFVFLSVLSFFGLLISLRTRHNAQRYVTIQKKIQSEAGIQWYFDAPRRSRWDWMLSGLRYDFSYSLMYWIAMGLFVTMAFTDFSFSEGFDIGVPWGLVGVLVIAILFVSGVALYAWRSPKDNG